MTLLPLVLKGGRPRSSIKYFLTVDL